MKGIILAAIFSLSSIFNFASASDPKVPITIIQAFQKSFPQAEFVKWDQYGQFIIASCVADGKEMTIYYSHEGELVVVAQIITESQLPKALVNDFRKKLANESQVRFYQMTSEGEVTYFCDVEKDGRRTLYSSVGKKWGVLAVRN